MGTRGPAPAAIFRRLAASEHAVLRQHFLRLGAEDRRLRFGGYADDERIRTYCEHLGRHRSILIGGFVAGELRAVGELKLIEATWPRAAELAISVEEPFRAHGLGTELCRRLIVRARNRFVVTLHMLCLLDNRPVQRIARKLGSSLAVYQGEVEAQLETPWPDPMSASEEWLDETDALLGVWSLAPASSRPCWGAPVPPGSLNLEEKR